MSQQFDPKAEVSISGEWVTVRFRVPFRRGEKFIHPRRLTDEVVDLGPSVSITLGRNHTPEELPISEIHMQGAWYTKSHTQLHGIREFTQTTADVVEYWAGQPFEDIRSMMPSLRKFLSTDKVLADRMEQVFAAKRASAIASAREKMNEAVLTAMAEIKELEGDQT